jgi:hypothetical protein
VSVVQGGRPLSDSARFYRLLTAPAEWIHRRVDRTELNPDGESTRRISFDLTIPAPWAITRDGGLVVPLMMLAKRPLTRLDVQGPTGSSVPVLGRRDNGALAYGMVAEVLRTVYGSPPSDELLAAVVDAVQGNDAEQTESRLAAFSRLLPPSEAAGANQGALVTALVEDLASQFVFAVLLPGDLAGRRVTVKVAVTEDVTAVADGQDDWLNPFGADARTLLVPLYVAGAAASVHYEFRCPPGLTVSQSTLYDGTDDVLLAPGPAQQTGFTVHFTGLEAGPARHDKVTVALRLDPIRDGAVRQTAWAVGLVAAMFGLAYWQADRITALMWVRQQGAIATAALAVPALFLTLQSRRPEHAAEARALLPARAANMASASLLYAAAVAVLFIAADPSTVSRLFLGLGIVQVVLSATYWKYYRGLSDVAPSL